MANIHSTITYNANLSAAQAQIKVLTGQIGALTAAFNTLDKSALSAQRSLASTFAAGVGQVGGFTTSTVKATNAVETFGKQIAANRLTMRQYFREAITGYTNQSSLMRRLAEQQVRYQQSVAVPIGGGQAMMMTPQNINLASNAAALASQRFAIFNKLIDGGATSMLNWGKNTQWAGRQLMVGFTVPLMLFTAVASKQFRELDRELTRFQKVYGSDLGNAISDSTDRMREQVKQLAYDISSTYGVAAKDTAALAADIAATGKEGEQLISSVQQTTRLAVLGEVDRQEAMKATLSLQSAFRMNTNELAESINFLNAVENQTSATLEDLATAIPKVGPVVRSLGGDVKDLATLLVAMREGGIPAAEAANALKSGLSALINPTKQASDVAKQFGIDLVGIVQANKGQLMPTIYAMQDALAGLDSFGRSRVIEQIFGRYQFARITALFDNIGRAGSQTQSVVDLASKSSTELAAVANQELRVLTESTAMRFQRTMEDLKNAIMPIGQVLTETLIPIFEFIGGGMKTLTSFFQSLPGPVKDFAKYGVAIAALAGPIIMMVGLFGNLIANGIKFGMMMTRLGARIAGVRIEKFELLNQDVMAAKLGVDGLTKSFDTQEVALRRLTRVLSAYEQSLRRLTTANPALFIPGALPAARGQVPIKRQAGSTRPEFVPGSGRGDKIPAMLEPGEFIVNRAATEKYAPVLLEMNRGTLKGFQDGTGRDDFRGYEQRKLKAPIGVPLQLEANTRAAGVIRGFSSLTASPQNLIGLFYKEIAASIRVPISAITDDFRKWQSENKTIINQFAKEYALAAGDAKKQRELIKKIDDRYVADMGGAKSNAGRFAKAAAAMEAENTKILQRAQAILVKHGVDLNDAAQVTQFYKNNLRDLSNITDKTELAALKLLQSLLTRGSYTDLGKVLSATMPLVPGQDRKAPAVAARYKDTGIPQQYIPAVIRSGSERRAFGLGFTREIQVYMRNMQLSVEHTATTLNQIGKNSANGLKNMTAKVAAEAKKILGIKSPSTVVDAEAQPIGRGIAEGAISGIRKGMQSAARRPIIAGPVGGTGLESISNAQKIAQADQAILKLKEMQLKHTADRVRADVELAALSRRYASGEINLIQFLEQKKQIELQQKDAAEKELRIQNIINEKKQAIVNADQAQLRAEQEEAKAAQRRATLAAAPMFGMGPGGSMGYFMTGVSPYAMGPGPSVGGSRFGNLSAEEKRELAALRRQGLDPTTRARYEAGLTRRQQRISNTNTGPAIGIGNARDQAQAGMRGMGAMNAMFALSMVTSSLSMMSGASQEATAKLGLFTTALMTASTLMMLRGPGGGIPSNFLGMGSLSNAAGAANLRKAGMTGATAAQAGQLRSLGYGKDLGKLSGALSVLGGPVGMGAAAAITGIAAAYLLVENAAEEARKRSVAAFEEPTKSAEYFGVAIKNVSQEMKDMQSGIEEPIDQGLRDAVKEDYGALIEKIRYGGAEAGARELSLVFNKMIASGLSAESATAAVKAIAVESGQAGGEAFAIAYREGLMRSNTPADVANRLAQTFDPELMNRNAEQIKQTIEQVDLGPLMDMASNSAELLDNTFGDILTGVVSFTSNLNQGMRFARMAITNILPEDNMFSQSINQMFDKDQMQSGIDTASNYSRTMEQLAANLAENMDVSSTQMIGIVETLFSTFKDAPTESMQAFDKISEVALTFNNVDFDPAPIQEFLNTLDPIAAITLNPLIQDNEELALKILKATAAGMDLQEILDAIANDRLDVEINVSIQIAEAEKEIRDLRDSLSQGLEGDLGGDIEILDSRIEGLTDTIDKLQKRRDKSLNRMQKNFDIEQEGRQDSIDGLEDELDARREAFDEEMKILDKKQEKIEKSSDAYIKSLEKNQKADSFYAQQRKTAFGALEKLASGDVFGFLQEREQMSADAQDFSYDQMISDIEERRDLELDSIDEIRDKRQEEQDEYEKMMEDKIEIIRDVMEEEQAAHEQAMIDEKKLFREKIRNAKEELREKRTQRKEIQDLLDAVKNDRILSEKELARVLPPLQAKQYVQEQKEIIKNIFLNEMNKAFKEGKTQQQATLIAASVVRPLINDLMPGAAAQNAQDIMKYLGAAPENTNYYGAPDGVSNPRGNTSTTGGGQTTTGGGQNPPTTWAGNEWPYGRTPTHRWEGSRENGRYVPIERRANGGKVTGPGGPKSDVIPAMLSNGEYVIQASSVSKYGKDMMDHINAGKFATGGYVSADRAEYQATGKYLGGYKPKPTYSGGTPTYTGGYNTANTQSSSNIYGPKTFKNKGTPMRPIFGMPIPNAQDLKRVSGYQENWFNTFLGSTWNSLLSGAGAAYSITGLGGMRSLPTVRPNASNQLIMNEASQYNLSARLAGMSPEEYARIPGNVRAMEAALFTASFTPGMGIAAGSIVRGAIRGSRSLFTPGALGAASTATARTGFGRTFGESYLDTKYRDAIISHLVKASDDPSLSLPPGTNLVTYGADPQKRALIEAFISKYPYSPLARAYMEGVAKPSVRPIRVIEGEVLDKISPIAARLLEDLKSQPRIGVVESNQVRFNKLAISDPEFIKLTEAERTALLDIAAFHQYNPSNVARSGTSVGLDSPDWARGQINKNEGNLFALLSTIAHESGHTSDFALGASGYASFGLGKPVKPYKRGIIGDIQFAARAGKTEAYAEVNRMRAIHALMSDIGADPQDIEMFTRGGLGAYPYYPGIRAGLYGNSPVFKAMFYKTMRDVMKGRNPYFQLPEGFSTKNSGILSDALGSAFPWIKSILSNPNNPAIGKLPVMSPSSIAPTKDEVIRLSARHSRIDESILDNVFGPTAGAVAGNHTPINPGGWVVGADGVKRYVKSSVYGGPSVVYTEAMLGKMYRALGLEVPDVDLLTIGGKTRSYAPNRSFQPGSLVLSSREIENIKTLSQIPLPEGMLIPKPMGRFSLPPAPTSSLNNPLHREMLNALNKEEGIGYATDQLFGLKDMATNIGNYGIKYDPNNQNTLLNPVRIDLGSNVFQDAGGNLIPFDPRYPLGKPAGLASHQKPPLHVGISPLAMRNQVARLQDVIESRGGIRGLLDQAIYELSQTSPTYTLGNPDFVEFVLQRRLQGLLDGEYLYANGGLVQKFANGGPVEMKKALDKWAGPKLKYHGGWSSAGSWGKNYPAGILMHHTSKPATDAQVDAMKNGYVWNGQFVKGPIVQSVISRDGTGHIIGYGNRNVGSGEGTTRYMDDKELGGLAGAIDAAGSANAALFQMEVISNGLVKDFTSEQFDTIAKISSGLREWMGWGTFDGRIINHKDWAVGRKNDTLYNRSVFVNNANKIWGQGGGSTSTTGENKGGKGSGGRNRSGDPVSSESPPTRGLFGALNYLQNVASNSENNNQDNSNNYGNAPTGDSTPAATSAVNYARNQLGKPYVTTPPGANPPDSWDCSKLTAWAWNQAVGKSILTPYSHTQANELTKRVVGLKNGRISGLSVGDILYFKTDGDSGGHTSIYAGNDTIIEASSPETGVRTTSVNNGWNNTNKSDGTPKFQWAGPPRGYAMGGFISGPGGPRSDMIPAMLSNGEYVVKASSVAKYGKGFMDKINSGSMNPFEGMSSIEPRMFANGGIVGSSPMPAFSMPEMSDASVGVTNTNYGGSSSSTRNSTKVNVVINGSGGKSANAIANKVISMINSANNRRNHSRSI